MPFIESPKNLEDLSDEHGFQFRFYCELCNDGLTTKKVRSQATQKSRRRGTMASILGTIGMNRASNLADTASDAAEDGWEREHQAQLRTAIQEAKGRFQKCPACKRYVCKDCWNTKKKKCSECASE